MIDHLVYATSDLEATVRDLGERLGVAPAPGGQHVGRGTRNYLLSLGSTTYLELIGPDPEQPDFIGTRPLGVDAVNKPQLTSWAIQVMDMDATIEAARTHGYDPGPARPMSRQQPDGELLSWRLTDVTSNAVPALLPYLIEWSDSPHPSQTAPEGVQLMSFHIESPDPDNVRAALAALNIEVAVERAQRLQLIAFVKGSRGRVKLE